MLLFHDTTLSMGRVKVSDPSPAQCHWRGTRLVRPEVSHWLQQKHLVEGYISHTNKAGDCAAVLAAVAEFQRHCFHPHQQTKVLLMEGQLVKLEGTAASFGFFKLCCIT